MKNNAQIAAPNKVIPIDNGWPFIGHTLEFMTDCRALHKRLVDKLGPVYQSQYMGEKVVHLMTPDGNEFVLLDRDKNFSSKLAWQLSLGKLFPNGLMLRDGDDHRWHRRLMSAPFKASALALYVDRMNPDIAHQVAQWSDEKQARISGNKNGNLVFYPEIKDLTLRLAAKVFIGEEFAVGEQKTEVDKINKAFVDVVNAAMVLVRYPMFGNKYQRGLKGRAYLEQYFKKRIGAKRQSQDLDMLAEICRASIEISEPESLDQSQQSLTDQDVIDHIIFLMMAAHDTTTSAMSSICYALAKNPEWQEKVRCQANLLKAESGDANLSYEQMSQFDSAELVLNESLRLYPPLSIIPRTAIKDCEFQGYKIPRGMHVHTSPIHTHRDPTIWSKPDTFDPERFNNDRAEDRAHRHAWVPFGGGMHKCLGLKFAEIQVKLILFHVLTRYQIEVPEGYEMPYQPAPIGKPKDQLPLRFRPIN